MLTLIPPNFFSISSIWSESESQSETSYLFPSLGKCKSSAEQHKIFLIPEILERIISHVSLSDLPSVIQVCKSWHHFGTPRLYRHVCFHGLNSFHNALKFCKSMDWNSPVPFGAFDPSIFSNGDMIRYAGLFLQRTLDKVRSAGSISKKESFFYLKSLILGEERKKFKPCQICQYSRALAEKSPAKEMLIPVSLGKYSHRFKGAIYGVVSLKSRKKFKDQPKVKALENASPCLQLHIHPFKCSWTTAKSHLYQTNGPFLRSLTFSTIDVTDEILCAILKTTKNLAFLCISSCPLVSDKVIEIASATAGNRLTHVTLAGLPRITDYGVQMLARNCLNLEGVDFTNSTKISEIGVKDLLSMCPFLTLLDLQRLGPGAGYAINDRFIPYVIAYGISLRYLCLAGCALRGHDVEKMINTMPSIMTWGLGFMQIGSRNLSQIKMVISEWMKSECLAVDQLDDFALTLTFANKKKIHLIGTKDDQLYRYFNRESQ